MSSSHTYSSYSSASYSSITSTNGQRTGTAYQQTTTSNPSGTTVNTRSQNLGEPVVQETRNYDNAGNQILEDGRVIGEGNAGWQQGRIADVEVEELDENENDRKYREAMEDEYAKREGGA